MRAYEFLHQVASKFAPMDESQRTELLGEAITEYKTFVDTYRVKVQANEVNTRWNLDHASDPDFEPRALYVMTFKDKIAEFIEKWWMRYLFAMLYVWIVPVLHRYMQGGDDEEEDDDDSDFMEYMRFKKMKRGL
jgi:hypothetical protein